MKKSRMDLSVSDQQLEKELKRSAIKRKNWRRFWRFFSSILVIGAALVLVSAIWLPIYQITGESMEPTLEQGQLVVALRTQQINPGDIVAMYFENQILMKRIIGISGDQIQLNEDGLISVNGISVEERYFPKPGEGLPDLTYPSDVPDGQYFVMGDNREKSTDSGIFQFGCIPEEKIIGKILFCVWPLNRIGYIG